MADDLRAVLAPELAVALERMAERYPWPAGTRAHTQDFLPLWLKELLEEYGEACAARTVRWMHERSTQRPISSSQIPVAHASWDDDVTPTVDPWKR